MITLVPMTAKMLNSLLDEPGMEKFREAVSHRNVDDILINSHHAYAALENDTSRVVFCAGLLNYWPGRAEAWSFFTPDAGKYFFRIHTFVKLFLQTYPVTRIEATVELNFERGIRWVALLGFKVEAPVLAQYREGQDYALFSIIDPHLPKK